MWRSDSAKIYLNFSLVILFERSVTNDLARLWWHGWALPRRIVLSYAPSAAAGWHFDGIRVIYGSKAERRSVVVRSVSRQPRYEFKPFCFESRSLRTNSLGFLGCFILIRSWGKLFEVNSQGVFQRSFFFVFLFATLIHTYNSTSSQSSMDS